MSKKQQLQVLEKAVKNYPDFPKEGIIFRDIFGIMQDVHALQALRDLLVEHVALMDIDCVVGLDSRGFLLGPLLSVELAKPFIPIRKKGKLPGKIFSENYVKEYGEDTFEIQASGIKGKKKALLVDDLLATGGSMSAAELLLSKVGVNVVECLVVMELKSLNGRSKIKAPVHSLLKYD
ncbi:adenine phosphoribosyltransferase [Trichogramma pretiosum]|uniref:Adenine phosphoribosyltransferase n=1 Tax=Trichogramma kaykai TaxID=54128 RepID=A0ABD2WNH6_9HYME|nr:adenine phosphoribosyltransferase [Trichogramma pretiosum]